jgi:uncharacterized iron-regulated membrane protein
VKIRKIIFWLHLLAGVFAGIVVFLMSITGVVLTYQKQMTEWADRSYWPPVSAVPQGNPLPLANLISRAAEAQPEAKPSAITFYSDPASPAMIAAQPGQNVFVNRYTGEATVGGSTAIRSFFRSATDLHRYLAMSGENRGTGRAVTGACNLAFLFIVCSGLYLWWPRTWTLPAVRSITWFRRGLTGKARDFNWHNVFGFWTAVPLFFIVLSGVVISYPWASSMLYKIAGTPQPARNGGARGAAPATRQDVVLDLAQLDSLLATAEQHAPGWRTINLRLPTTADKQVTFSIDRSFGGQPQKRSTLVLDKQTGRIARTQAFSDQTAGERARSWMRFVHTGEFYGVAGQTIAGIASSAGAILVFTGLSLAVRRLLAWISRKNRSAMPVSVGTLQEE